MGHRIKMLYEAGLMEFTVVMAPLEQVSSIAKGLFRWGRHKPANPDGHDLNSNQIRTLRRNKVLQIPIISEREYLVFEPIEEPGFSVIIHSMDYWFPQPVSILLPDATCITLESVFDIKRRQRNSIMVKRDGKEVRFVDASIGYETPTWTWEESGTIQDWEDPQTYTARYPSQRLTRQVMVENAKRLGFDPLQFYEKGLVARSSRFRD